MNRGKVVFTGGGRRRPYAVMSFETGEIKQSKLLV